ncbi:MAG: serine O-acetyltransferase EpsC [Chitinophagales bacterium]|nr:serine acetyltransferase [Chitinophagales bacterium]MDW8274281.1 serine O-acetyltransferase EpsC [Chitinophagales bacterium]
MASELMLKNLPSRLKTQRFTDVIQEFMFPVENEIIANEDWREDRIEFLKIQLEDLLSPLEEKLQQSLSNISTAFFKELPKVQQMLNEDAIFFERSDPAAESIEEVIITYPGFTAVVAYRVAHVLYRLGVPVLPRLITEYAHGKTGIDIHPGASIAAPFFIDHGTGVVIGQTTVIGKNVKIYQGVTLGALAVQKEQAGVKRHPTIEDNVIIYAGSCILGGNTVIGHDSIIGGNVFLTESVPPFSFVYHKSEVKIRDKSEMGSVIDFVI